MHPEHVATYRLQLCPEFGFEEATQIIDYLADLGISHVYTSPYLQAAENSKHGYDIVDPTRINAQLGTNDSYQKFCDTIHAASLGLLIDIVPNHMAILGKQNPWWWDVLENGPSSFFANYFDVDWSASEERWPNKVLLPVLADHYGRVLEKGEIQLSFQNGSMSIQYGEQSFPIDPTSLSDFLTRVSISCDSELLAFLAESYSRLPKPTVTSPRQLERRHRDKTILLKLLNRLCEEEPQTKEAILAEISRVNKDSDALDVLIEKQNYRLAFWRTANKDLGYRRFFDIKDLVGLRIENLEVFHSMHALPFEWFSKGWVQGFRVDHPDGLLNPGEYFRRLEHACPGAWVIAEKILKSEEKLPSSWEIAGTTGYDFLNLLNELFIDSKGEEGLTKIYADLIGNLPDFNVLVYQCKLLTLDELFGSELNRLATLFQEICERHRRYRDYTRSELKEALCQTAACFPVYRSYVSASEKLVTSDDEAVVNKAIEFAKEKRPDLDPELFKFLQDLLLLRISGELENELAMRFQQLTGPAMAKGFEDTALYRYHRLVSLNEVGGDPSVFGISLSQFHEACLESQKNYSRTLLASTTHDTKHSEDFRARLALLAEMVEQWEKAVQRWVQLNEKHHHNDLLDRNTEYLFYQILVGAWPIDLERCQAYMQKAVREGKENTSWNKPNEEYEGCLRNFITKVVQDKEFISDFQRFVEPLINKGRINSLSQTLIKLTAPGVPDIYQGSELWNLTLVDPDNRGKVDFSIRRLLLDEVKKLSLADIMKRIDEGLPKLWIIYQTLHLRRKNPKIFTSEGIYKPVYAQGKKADHIVAFMRGDAVMTIAPRFNFDTNWEDTGLELPAGVWHNLFTGENIEGDRLIPVKTLLERFPVSLLVKSSYK